MSSSTTLPLADAPFLWRYARRTRRVRIGLGVALLRSSGSRSSRVPAPDARPTSYFAAGGSGIVVIDLSASVDPRANVKLAALSAHTRRQRPAPRARRRSRSRRTSSSRPGREATRSDRCCASSARRDRSSAPPSPWSRSFLGGTSIGQGLRLARQIIERAGGGSAAPHQRPRRTRHRRPAAHGRARPLPAGRNRPAHPPAVPERRGTRPLRRPRAGERVRLGHVAREERGHGGAAERRRELPDLARPPRGRCCSSVWPRTSTAGRSLRWRTA